VTSTWTRCPSSGRARARRDSAAGVWTPRPGRVRLAELGVRRLDGTQLDAHAAACARDRGWPLVTADATRYATLDELGVEELP